MTTTTLMNALGWTLVHFVWQGVLIGVLLALALVAGNRRRGVNASRYRYGVALAALTLVVLTPAVTFLWQLLDSPGKTIQPVNINLALASIADAPAVWLSVRESWLNYLLLAWFVGVFWGSARLLISWLSLYMVRHSGIQPAPLWLEQDFRRLRQECRILRPVSILVSTVVRVPLTAGWMQPVILLPATALTGLQPEQIRLILRHELAHIQRYDYLVNWIQNLVQVLLFYHPVVHWIIRILNDERELCCDHEAIDNRCRPVDYAKILVKLQEARVPQLALAASGKRGGLYRRVQRLLNSEAEHMASSHDTSRSFAWIFTVILSALVTTVGVVGSPNGYAAYDHTVQVPIIHPLSDIPAMVEQRSEQRQQLIRYHQQTNFASFEWPSALGPLSDDEEVGEELLQENQPSVPLSVLHRQMMRSVRQQLPDDSVTFDDPMAAGNIATADYANAYQTMDAAKLATDLPDLLISDQKMKIPEPYVKVKPQYPRRLSGLFEHETVDVVYNIGPDGQPENIVVLSLNVHKDFADAATEALEQWRFHPVSSDMQKLRISQRFNFLQVQTSVKGNCSVTGGRLCPKFGHLLHRIQVNKPFKADT